MNPIVKEAARFASPHVLKFANRHKKKAMHAGRWAAGQVMRRQKRSLSVGAIAFRGLGAAALAVPVGLWVGRKLLGGSES